MIMFDCIALTLNFFWLQCCISSSGEQWLKIHVTRGIYYNFCCCSCLGMIIIVSQAILPSKDTKVIELNILQQVNEREELRLNKLSKSCKFSAMQPTAFFAMCHIATPVYLSKVYY